jgi:predicted naringenin-chalcone synthase
MSLKVALEELGAGPCLHPLDEPEPDSTHWQQIADGEQVDWREAFEGFGSTVDWLGARYYGEMIEAWPQARVILSVRDPESWYESCHASLDARRRLMRGNGHGQQPIPPVLKAVDGAIWDGIFNGRFDERDYALEVFDRHNREVASRIPDERLLVFDIRQGWEPLCEFLGVDVPDRPFPHLNARNAPWAWFGAPAPPAELEPEIRPSTPRAATVPAPVRNQRSDQIRVRISGLEVCDPPTSYSQEQVLEHLGLDQDEFAQRIFARSGVKRRNLNLESGFLDRTLQGRTAQVEQELTGYAIRAVDGLGVDPGDIGTIISSSLYSLDCPTLAHRLIEHYEMDPATDKYHITGVGCASGVPLMRMASSSLHQHPGKCSLVVAAESMSGLLMRATDEDPRAKTVGSAIFGDGCAAALISGEPDAAGPTILASQVHQVSGTLGAVAMALQPHDSYLHLARELPDLAAEGLRELVESFLARSARERSEIAHWIVHPGGRRIIESVQEALDLSREDVAVSWDALANQGNIGTPSIFYVLKDVVTRCAPQPGELGLAVTIGPGITVGLMLLGW